jgi:hypothetical protein
MFSVAGSATLIPGRIPLAILYQPGVRKELIQAKLMMVDEENGLTPRQWYPFLPMFSLAVGVTTM